MPFSHTLSQIHELHQQWEDKVESEYSVYPEGEAEIRRQAFEAAAQVVQRAIDVDQPDYFLDGPQRAVAIGRLLTPARELALAAPEEGLEELQSRIDALIADSLRLHELFGFEGDQVIGHAQRALVDLERAVTIAWAGAPLDEAQRQELEALTERFSGLIERLHSHVAPHAANTPAPQAETPAPRR